MLKEEKPQFDLKFERKDGKFRECSDENAEPHPGDKIGYCHKHHILFCSYCMVGTHSACLTQITVHPALENKLKELAVEVEEVIRVREDIANGLVNRFEVVISSIDANCKAIEEFGQLIIDTITELVKEYQEEQIKINNKFKREVTEYKENLGKSITNCSKIKEECKGIKDLKVNLPTLINKYEQLKELYEEESKKDLYSYEEIVSKLVNDKGNKLEYNKDLVIDQIKVGFKGIIGKGYSVAAEQSNSEYLCIANPLTTHITLFDIYNKSAIMHNLSFKDKPFSIPYGSTCMLYNNRILITGGTISFIDYLKTCYEYSILMDDIKECPNFLKPSSYHAMIELNGNAYIIGGKDENGYLARCEACNISLKNSLSLYDWHEIPPLTEAKSGVAVCACENFIYTFGGIGIKAKTSKKIEMIAIDEPVAFGTVERLDVSCDKLKWEKIGSVVPEAFYLGVVEGRFKGTDGFFIFGGMYKKNEPMKETLFIDIKELKEDKEVEGIKIKGCEIEEFEGLANRAAKWQRGLKQLWLPGKLNIYCMTFSNEDGSPQWNICNNYTRQFT